MRLLKPEGTISAGSVVMSISAIVPRNLWKSIREVNVPHMQGMTGRGKEAARTRACHSKRSEAARKLEKGKKPTETTNLGTNQVFWLGNEQDPTKRFQKLGSILAPSTSWIHSKRLPRNLTSSGMRFVF
jgi:hypothetical protein